MNTAPPFKNELESSKQCKESLEAWRVAHNWIAKHDEKFLYNIKPASILYKKNKEKRKQKSPNSNS